MGFLGIFLVISPRGVFAQPLLDPKGLVEDVKVLRRAMVHLHPGLYRFHTPEEMEGVFLDLEREMGRPRTKRDAFLAISRVVARVRSGATRVDVEESGGDKVPFHFRWDDGRMIVTASADEQLKSGDEIESINGERAGDLGRALLRYVSADGGNDGNRWAQLEVRGQGVEVFDVYQPLLLPPGGDGYRVKLAGEDAPAYTVRPMTVAGRRKALGGEEKTWEFEVMDGRVGYLRMGTFAVGGGEFDWRKSLAESFGEMRGRGVREVILDLRGNEGGASEVVVELAKYVVWQPAVMPGARRTVRYEVAPEDLRPYVKMTDEGFWDLRGRVEPGVGGTFVIEDADWEALQPGPEALIARYWLLVDAHNSGAAFLLAQFLQDNRLATVVGETTGGSQKGMDGGPFAVVTLPNTGIVVRIPLVAIEPVTARGDGGVRPDVVTGSAGALGAARRLAVRR